MNSDFAFSRRRFLASNAPGIGGLVLASLFAQEGLLAEVTDPMAPRLPPLPAKAKRCIFFLPEGGPSQMDLFDPKPKLQELHGQKLPESLVERVRFAFIKKETAVLAGSPRVFRRHGQCGMELSDFLPRLGECADDLCLIRSMHTDSFNHHPAQLMLNSGIPRFGRPSMGSWLTYGLGTESADLPAYVVLTAGRGGSGGVSNWSSGFLPSTYQGVLLRNQGDPILHLTSPPGVTREQDRVSLDALRRLNQQRLTDLADPEIASRIAAYELAFRMQSSAPELVDLTRETAGTLEEYGLNRPEPEKHNVRGGGPHVYRQFATNCLLARRLVERGVRFVTVLHASWDHHSNLDEELAYNAGMADQPIAALLKDLKRRGLLDSTLVLFAGEFGRTPLAENRGGVMPDKTGRDHHPFAFSVWMAGGGVRPGLTYGATDELGWAPTENPVHIHDLHATILRLFGFDHRRFVAQFKGLDVRLTDQGGKVVEPLLG